MDVVRRQLRQQRLWTCLAVLLGLLTFYCASFWQLPLSEDAGFYGYLSRAIANGMVLHRDVFFSSNSIALYGTALVFRLAGASLDSYRLVHAVGLFALVLAVFFVVSRGGHNGRGLLAASLAGTFSVLPHIVLDLGRNYLVWATVFVLLGYYVQSTGVKSKEVYSGVLLGVAALIRETFVVAGIGLLAYEIGRMILRDRHDWRNACRPVLTIAAAFLLALSINALILTCCGTWGGYLRDMLDSGTSFRYDSGFLDPARIGENLAQLRHGFRTFYYPLVVLAALSYLAPSEGGFVRRVKLVLVPLFLVEALVINRTSTYSVVPILVFASILSSHFLFQLAGWLRTSIQIRIVTPRAAASVLVLVFVAVSLSTCGPNTVREFQAYYELAREMSRTTLADSTEHTSRMLYIADLLPHQTVSSVSEYPFLFLSPNFYWTNPFVEDLTASANLGRPDIWAAQLDYLRTTPTDLLILKTTDTYPPKGTDLGQIVDENYMMVYDFPLASGSTAYKNRILLSHNAFQESYQLWKEETGDTAFKGFNDGDDAIIISVTTTVPEAVGSCSVSTGLSRTLYAEEYESDPLVFSVVPPKFAFRVEMADSTYAVDRQFQIRYYVRNEAAR